MADLSARTSGLSSKEMGSGGAGGGGMASAWEAESGCVKVCRLAEKGGGAEEVGVMGDTGGRVGEGGAPPGREDGGGGLVVIVRPGMVWRWICSAPRALLMVSSRAQKTGIEARICQDGSSKAEGCPQIAGQIRWSPLHHRLGCRGQVGQPGPEPRRPMKLWPTLKVLGLAIRMPLALSLRAGCLGG